MPNKPTKKERLKVIGINLILFAILYGLVELNKGVIRPAIIEDGIAKILSGCFPNFIAAYIIGLFFVNSVFRLKPKRSRLFVYGGAIAVAVILIFEELLSVWGASTHYDIYDIAASVFGAVLAILTYEFIKLLKAKKEIKKQGRNPA